VKKSWKLSLRKEYHTPPAYVIVVRKIRAKRLRVVKRPRFGGGAAGVGFGGVVVVDAEGGIDGCIWGGGTGDGVPVDVKGGFESASTCRVNVIPLYESDIIIERGLLSILGQVRVGRSFLPGRVV
jgi:hypothetical protein